MNGQGSNAQSAAETEDYNKLQVLQLRCIVDAKDREIMLLRQQLSGQEDAAATAALQDDVNRLRAEIHRLGQENAALRAHYISNTAEKAAAAGVDVRTPHPAPAAPSPVAASSTNAGSNVNSYASPQLGAARGPPDRGHDSKAPPATSPSAGSVDVGTLVEKLRGLVTGLVAEALAQQQQQQQRQQQHGQMPRMSQMPGPVAAAAAGARQPWEPEQRQPPQQHLPPVPHHHPQQQHQQHVTVGTVNLTTGSQPTSPPYPQQQQQEQPLPLPPHLQHHVYGGNNSSGGGSYAGPLPLPSSAAPGGPPSAAAVPPAPGGLHLILQHVPTPVVTSAGAGTGNWAGVTAGLSAAAAPMVVIHAYPPGTVAPPPAAPAAAEGPSGGGGALAEGSGGGGVAAAGIPACGNVDADGSPRGGATGVAPPAQAANVYANASYVPAVLELNVDGTVVYVERAVLEAQARGSRLYETVVQQYHRLPIDSLGRPYLSYDPIVFQVLLAILKERSLFGRSAAAGDWPRIIQSLGVSVSYFEQVASHFGLLDHLPPPARPGSLPSLPASPTVTSAGGPAAVGPTRGPALPSHIVLSPAGRGPQPYIPRPHLYPAQPMEHLHTQPQPQQRLQKRAGGLGGAPAHGAEQDGGTEGAVVLAGDAAGGGVVGGVGSSGTVYAVAGEEPHAQGSGAAAWSGSGAGADGPQTFPDAARQLLPLRPLLPQQQPLGVLPSAVPGTKTDSGEELGPGGVAAAEAAAPDAACPAVAAVSAFTVPAGQYEQPATDAPGSAAEASTTSLPTVAPAPVPVSGAMLPTPQQEQQPYQPQQQPMEGPAGGTPPSDGPRQALSDAAAGAVYTAHTVADANGGAVAAGVDAVNAGTAKSPRGDGVPAAGMGSAVVHPAAAVLGTATTMPYRMPSLYTLLAQRNGTLDGRD